MSPALCTGYLREGGNDDAVARNNTVSEPRRTSGVTERRTRGIGRLYLPLGVRLASCCQLATMQGWRRQTQRQSRRVGNLEIAPSTNNASQRVEQS